MFRFQRLPQALDYAAEAHRFQKRKGTQVPYLSHLMGVSSLVLEFGGDEDQAIAGLLHDVLEDCGPEHEGLIRERFGNKAADIVRSCTDGVPDAEGVKPEWRERKEAYLRHLQGAPSEVLLVSACDKLHNARAIATDLAAWEDVFPRFKGGQEGTLWYYRALLEVFRERLGPRTPVVLELEAAVARMGEA